MPKRVLDGEAMWGSQRIRRLPEWVRLHYAWLYPLAMANGVFECDPRQIWARCYAVNMEHVAPADVNKVLDQLEQERLLFRWEQDGKTWGYWTNSHKPGRLPPASRVRKGHEALGPNPPADKLKAWLANGCLGFGMGLGLGIGLGEEEAPASAPTLHFEGRWVKISAEQHARLVAAFPDVDVQRCYGECDLWQDAHPSRRKENQYSAMLNWLKRERKYRKENGNEASAGAGPAPPVLTLEQEKAKWRRWIEKRKQQLANPDITTGTRQRWEQELRGFEQRLAECGRAN